jgi:enoyl-CoA hydratase/carnithine racemase
MGEAISGADAAALGIITQAVPVDDLDRTAAEVTRHLSTGPTRAYAATRALLKTWSSGGVAAADAVMLDLTMDLFESEDAIKGFANTAKAFDADIEPPAMTFAGK